MHTSRRRFIMVDCPYRLMPGRNAIALAEISQQACITVNHVRDVAMGHLLIQPD